MQVRPRPASPGNKQVAPQNTLLPLPPPLPTHQVAPPQSSSCLALPQHIRLPSSRTSWSFARPAGTAHTCHTCGSHAPWRHSPDDRTGAARHACVAAAVPEVPRRRCHGNPSPVRRRQPIVVVSCCELAPTCPHHLLLQRRPVKPSVGAACRWLCAPAHPQAPSLNQRLS